MAGRLVGPTENLSGVSFIYKSTGDEFCPTGVPINTGPETGVAVDPIYRELVRPSPATLTADTVSSTSRR